VADDKKSGNPDEKENITPATEGKVSSAPSPQSSGDQQAAKVLKEESKDAKGSEGKAETEAAEEAVEADAADKKPKKSAKEELCGYQGCIRVKHPWSPNAHAFGQQTSPVGE
jgi:hypothetical protein